MTTISAKTILRSRNAAQPHKVLSTLLLRYPRWIHAEGRTHRVLNIGEDLEIFIPTTSLMEDENLSRNAASSRAIPLEKQIAAMLAEPAAPLWWGAEQKGMQAYVELEGSDLRGARAIWDDAMHSAIAYARRLADIGAHKQIVNRVIEPFTHITVLVSATEWDNFLELRDHEMAEPHIRMLAREVRRCLETGPVQTLHPGDWHTPFVSLIDMARLDAAFEAEKASQQDFIRLSVGRCASTSYKTVDGFDMTLDRATALHDQFVNSRPQHASPLEHVAQADWTHKDTEKGWKWSNESTHGNFVGFRQYRHMV